MSKEFDTLDVLTVTTGALCKDMDGACQILNYLTQDNLYTHQLPRALEACMQHVQDQHPDLVNIDMTLCNPDTVNDWQSWVHLKYGTTRTIEPLPVGVWSYKDPVEELAEKMSK